MIVKKNILVFPCGSEIGLEVNRALAKNIHFEMFGASSSPDHGRFVYKNYIEGIPFVDSDDFISSINDVCEKYSIDFIVPAHDSVVLKLAQNAENLKAKVITSPLETCEIARSKKKTYDILKDTVHCPKVYNIYDKEINYPVFIKPDVGQGSKGAKKVEIYEQLKFEYEYVYVDLDDTLICDNIVNTDVIKFLYQTKNQNKKIILISKHEKEIAKTLDEYCISQKLFDKILHLEKKDKKSMFIKEKGAIFIDDSYAERKDVAVNCKIPVFSIDAVETLLDWKN